MRNGPSSLYVHLSGMNRLPESLPIMEKAPSASVRADLRREYLLPGQQTKHRFSAEQPSASDPPQSFVSQPVSKGAFRSQVSFPSVIFSSAIWTALRGWYAGSGWVKYTAKARPPVTKTSAWAPLP